MTLTFNDRKYLSCVGRAGDAGTTLTDVAREFCIALPMANIYLSVLVALKHVSMLRGRYYITPKGAKALGVDPRQIEMQL